MKKIILLFAVMFSLNGHAQTIFNVRNYQVDWKDMSDEEMTELVKKVVLEIF